MDNEVEELQFRSLWEKRQQNLRGIIAVSGLPSTHKTRIAYDIGQWAKCPVLCINHFFCQKSKAPKYTQEEEEEERLVQENAFTNLCKVAGFHMSRLYRGEQGVDSTLVIKSRLNTTSELQELLFLAINRNIGLITRMFPLLIIESHIENKFKWKNYFESLVLSNENSEYKGPRTWEEMEKVRDDYRNPQSPLAPPNWDLYLQQFMLTTCGGDIVVVRRLLIDTLSDFSSGFAYGIFLGSSTVNNPINRDLFDAITFLLTCTQEEFRKVSRNPYTVELHELRPYVLEKRVRNTLARVGRSRYLCSSGDCIFYEVAHDINGVGVGVCGACGKEVDSRTQSAYACRLCILTLHKSCAERIDFKELQDFMLEYYSAHIEIFLLKELQEYGCEKCDEEGGGFSYDCGSCVYQAQLKSGVIPTILKHNAHPHFLSLMLNVDSYYCKACGGGNYLRCSYCCRKCGVYYHILCCIMPLELLKHKHGGHEHVMKLVFSLDEDLEESYWCDVCYEDMDPYHWSYFCDKCPYYSAHLRCAGGYEYLKNIKDAKFVEQLQSQLEDLSLS